MGHGGMEAGMVLELRVLHLYPKATGSEVIYWAWLEHILDLRAWPHSNTVSWTRPYLSIVQFPMSLSSYSHSTTVGILKFWGFVCLLCFFICNSCLEKEAISLDGLPDSPRTLVWRTLFLTRTGWPPIHQVLGLKILNIISQKVFVTYSNWCISRWLIL